MLPRHQRLSRQRIEYVFKKGKKIAKDIFILKILPNFKPASRFCVIVSTKIEAKAVKRNLLRRRIYEAIRLHQNDKGNQEKNYDVILIPSNKIVQSSFQEIEKNILSLLQTLYHQK